MTVVTRTMPALRIEGARPDDHVIVLFGATGDLAKRKLLPGLYHLFEAGLLPRRYRIIGTSRRPLGDDEFRALARQATEEFGRLEPGPRWDEFAANLAYAASDVGAADELAAATKRAEDAIGGEVRRLHYLSVPPQAMAGIVETLGAAGLADGARVIMEKPFGTDLETARALNAVVHGVFPEEQVFRIDHFLGKEAVQNVLALRFANGLFEPIWNRDHVDHVQLDVPETLSIGTRAGFYDATGAFRDMVVTHLFQVLGFAAMEPPVSLAAKPLVDEKVKVFESMRPLDPARVVRGRYAGYLDEEGVAADSQTETFVALEAFIDNWRWADVPFYLRTGKRLRAGRRTLTVVFREPPRSLFPGSLRGSRTCSRSTSASRARSRRASSRRCPARRWSSGRRGSSSATRSRSRPRSSSRRTSGSSTTRCSATAPCSRARTGSSGCGRCRRRCCARPARCTSTSRARGARPRPTSCCGRGAGTSPTRARHERAVRPRRPRRRARRARSPSTRCSRRRSASRSSSGS